MPGDGGRDDASFDAFVLTVESRLHGALAASFGHDLGREATAEALAFAWETWPKVTTLDNPVAYLFKVGRSRVRVRKTPVLYTPPAGDVIYVEPALASALGALPNRQRQAVALIHGEGWTLKEVGELLDLSIPTVQKHAERGLAHLRRKLGVVVPEQGQ